MPAIHRDDRKHRYVIDVDGREAGFLQYVERPGRVILVHTEVHSEFEGHGLAGQLAAYALDDIRARGLRVVPLCPYVEHFLEQHPDYEDLVDHAALAALEEKQS